MNTKLDIIERLNDDELYVDAIDDAITEISKLRREVEQLNRMLKMTKDTVNLFYEWGHPDDDKFWQGL